MGEGIARNSQRRRGRPRLPAESLRRHVVTVRTTRQLKERLQRASEASGRSLPLEAEHRLEQSFEQQDIAARLGAHLEEVRRRAEEELTRLRSKADALITRITERELDERMAARGRRSLEEVGQRLLDLLAEEQTSGILVVAGYAAAPKEEVKSSAEQAREAVSRLLTILKPATGEG